MKKEKSLSEKVIHYIEEHLSEPLSLEQIARQLGYSKYHLSRTFTKEIGYGMHQYLQKKRLDKAAQQLVETGQTISEIAFEAGYDSQQAFTYAFKRYYLVSPYVYRKDSKLGVKQMNMTLRVLPYSMKRQYAVVREEMAA